MELAWSKKMSIGNETIVTERKKILDLVNEVESVIQTKDCELFMQALDMLEKSTRRHFEHEEMIAHVIDFHFLEHDMEHQYILDCSSNFFRG